MGILPIIPQKDFLSYPDLASWLKELACFSHECSEETLKH
jgi:hypothetical protein